MKTENKKTNIPEGWTMTRLGDVTVFNYGKGLNAKNRVNGNVPVYGSNGITGFHNVALMNESGYIIGRKGTIGSIYCSKVPFYPIDTTYYLTSKDIKLNFNYFYYLFKTLNLNQLNSDSAVPGLNRNALYSLSIIIPKSLIEQQAIAAVLSSLDDKIELLREQNKTLEAIAQAIYKRWFVDFEFPATEPKNSATIEDEQQPKADGVVFNTLQLKGYKSSGGKMVESELGEIPEGWRVGTVNDVIERFSITYRCNQKDLSQNGKTPILDQGSNGLYGYTERSPDFQASIENPVIIFANHTCYTWFINYPFCAIQNVIPFRGNKEYSIFFVFYMIFGQVKFIEYKGHWPDFEQKKYVIPKPKIANQFAEIIKPLQYSMWNNNAQIQTLSALRDSLLPKLMSGKIRVPVKNEAETTPSAGGCHHSLTGGELTGENPQTEGEQVRVICQN